MGRDTSSGHSPSGQLFENHSSARSMRLTLISAPHSSAASFLPSLSARELTVESGTRSISAYRRATLSSESMPDMAGISVSLPDKSTAFLPDAHRIVSGHSTGMDLAVILENIERQLRIKKMSSDKASRLAGKPDAIRNIKRKLKGEIQGDGITVKTLEALAGALGSTVDELTTPRERINISPVPGLRDSIIAKLEWLDRERDRALQELSALDQAENSAKKAAKRKIR
ncbi:MAG: hypothetical protein ABFD89_18600 [Bryobacteraceae bacterium]